MDIFQVLKHLQPQRQKQAPSDIRHSVLLQVFDCLGRSGRDDKDDKYRRENMKCCPVMKNRHEIFDDNIQFLGVVRFNNIDAVSE